MSTNVSKLWLIVHFLGLVLGSTSTLVTFIGFKWVNNINLRANLALSQYFLTSLSAVVILIITLFAQRKQPDSNGSHHRPLVPAPLIDRRKQDAV